MRPLLGEKMSSNTEPMILILTGEPLAPVHKNEMEFPGLTLATSLAARAPGPQVRSEFFAPLIGSWVEISRVIPSVLPEATAGPVYSVPSIVTFCTYPCAAT